MLFSNICNILMKIEVKDPKSSQVWLLEVNSTKNNNESGWSVVMPYGNSIFLIRQRGEWKVRYNEMLNLEVVEAIGKAIVVD